MSQLRSRLVLTLAAALLPAHICRAQVTVVTLGYSGPGAFKGAPGKVVNLWVRGLNASTTFADHLPLPTTLAGVTIRLRSTEGGPEFLAPIFSVIGATGGASVSLVTFQIPTELPAGGGPILPAAGYFLNVNSGENVTVALYLDNIHVIGSCWPDFCAPVVTHADGTLVGGNGFGREGRPAKAGEQLVIYAFGLGPTTPLVPSGTASDRPLPLAVGASLQFDFGINVPPAPNPFLKPQVTPVSAVLTPGFVGLYQINFIVPEPPPGLRDCRAFGVQGSGNVSNLTITVSGRTSFDGAGICVEPQ